MLINPWTLKKPLPKYHSCCYCWEANPAPPPPLVARLQQKSIVISLIIVLVTRFGLCFKTKHAWHSKVEVIIYYRDTQV